MAAEEALGDLHEGEEGEGEEANDEGQVAMEVEPGWPRGIRVSANIVTLEGRADTGE